jgi:hypothetical protein
MVALPRSRASAGKMRVVMHRPLALVLALAALAACGNKDRQVCAARAAEVGRFLSAMDRSGQVVDGAGMVVRADLPRIELRAAPVVDVRGHKIRFQGQRFEGDALVEELKLQRTMILDRIAHGRTSSWRGDGDGRRVLLMFDAAATWDRVVAVVEAATAAGFESPELVFGVPSRAQPPPRSAIDDELDRLEAQADVTNKATQLAEIVQRVVKGCPALTRSFGGVRANEDKAPAETLIASIEPALVECGCSVDVDAVRSVVWRVLTNPHPVTVLAIRVDRGAKAIELPAATPWREASKSFTGDGARAVALRVRP